MVAQPSATGEGYECPAGVEPPVGIEPTTYSLRVNRSTDWAKAACVRAWPGQPAEEYRAGRGLTKPASAGEAVLGDGPADQVVLDGAVDASVAGVVAGVAV